MEKVQFVQKYNENQNLVHSKHLIDSFVEFFGEEYRNIITEKILNTPIIWYIPELDNKNSSIRESIITSLSEEKLQYIIDNVKSDQLRQSAYNPIYNFLVLPINGDITHIIHEICHRLTCHILRKEPTLLILNGIGISDEKYEGFFQVHGYELDEIINQRMTKDIEAIYKTKVTFDSTLSYQDMFFPLIEKFYTAFKQEIIKSEMTGNIVQLLNLIGVQEFEQYQQLFFRLIFKLSRNKQKGTEFFIDNNSYIEAEGIVDEMIENSRKIDQQHI